MNPELAELSRTIDPGELGRRIKNARVAAGMTQAQVAGGEVTTAYISRIEDGQRRPEASLLERMTARMNTSLEELLLGISPNKRLELQLAIDHAELQLASGNAEQALTSANQILDELAGMNVPALLRAASQVRALALEATGDLDGAIVALEELTGKPAPDAGWLKALIALSRCYRESGDFARAISVGETAQAEIERLGIAGLTEAIQLSITVAGAYMFQGDLGHAMRICQRAVAAATEHDSPIARASAYWNASLIESRRGSLEEAVSLANKALAIFEVGEDARNLARLRSEVANMQLQLDPPDVAGAIETLDQALREMAWSAATTYETARALITRARAYYLLGDHPAALDYVNQAVEMAPQDAPMMKSTALALMGRIAAAQGRVGDARDLYQQAVQTMSSIGADREAAQLWFDLGGSLSEIGETEAALDAFRRAAASTGLTATNPSGISAGISVTET